MVENFIVIQLTFAEIFVPQDFTIRLLLGSVEPQTHVREGTFKSTNSLPPCIKKSLLNKYIQYVMDFLRVDQGHLEMHSLVIVGVLKSFVNSFRTEHLPWHHFKLDGEAPLIAETPPLKLHQ